MPCISFDPNDPIYAFLSELAPLVGSPKEAAGVLVRGLPLYRAWAAKVGRCPTCRKLVPLWPDHRIDAHRVRNPHGDRPYWMQCPGEDAVVQPLSEEPVFDLEIIQVRFEHRIDTLQAGLL